MGHVQAIRTTLVNRVTDAEKAIEASWQVGSFWALVLAEVVDCLVLAAAKRNLL